MALTGTKELGSTLTEEQARALAGKLEAFYGALTPQEQAHLNAALRRMADEGADVSGHAVLSEYALLLFLIVMSL